MHKRCTVGAALFFFILCFALSIPAIASAQLFSGSIVPCGQVGTGTLCAANELRICTLCDLVALIQRVLSFLIFLATLISVLLFVYAGILMIMSGGNSGELSRAKNIFWNVLVGFIIVLAAFLIINVIMTTLYRGDDEDADVKGPWRPWQTIICDQVLDRAQVCKPLVKPSVDAQIPPPYEPFEYEVCYYMCNGNRLVRQGDNGYICFKNVVRRTAEGACSIARQAAEWEFQFYQVLPSCFDRARLEPPLLCPFPDILRPTRCGVVTIGPCTTANLEQYFDVHATNASRVCGYESRGDPDAESGSDRLIHVPEDSLRGIPPTPAFSFGLFQINITVHNLTVPECPQFNCASAFSGRDSDAVFVGMNASGQVVDPAAYERSAALYTLCRNALKVPSCNIAMAKKIFVDAGPGWLPWQNTARICGIPF